MSFLLLQTFFDCQGGISLNTPYEGPTLANQKLGVFNRREATQYFIDIMINISIGELISVIDLFK